MKKLLVFFFWLIILGFSAFNPAYSSEPVIVGQITDEHLEPGTSVPFERLKNILGKIKALSPDLLISTGDHTLYNDLTSYNQYNLAFPQIGSFDKFPTNFYLDSLIPFVPIAGNHDGWNNCPYDNYKTIQSFTIGDYRFVGFSHNLRYDFPYQEIENELVKSCQDGKSIIVFTHYCPHNWISDPNLDIGEEAWARLDGLMQKYPVIAYLAGHNHNNRTESFSPGYLAHTGGRAAVGALTAAGLSQGKINLFYELSLYTPLIITEPSQYYAGLDYTKTKKGMVKVRAYAKANNSSISRIFYQLDLGNSVLMNRVGQTDYYEADLNALALNGQHTITVTAKNSKGLWADGKQQITVSFDDLVSPRAVPACNSSSYPEPSATPTPPLTPQPTSTPTPIATSTPIPTSSPTPFPTPINSANTDPVISAPGLFPIGYLGKSYSFIVEGYDPNMSNNLVMKIQGPPPGLSLKYCNQQIVNNQKIIKCPFSGTPTARGTYYGRILLSDGVIQVTKNITVIIK